MLYHIYLLCAFRSRFVISYSFFPSNSMCAVPSMSACKNAPGMLATTMCLFSFALISQDNIIASNDTVGELASSFVVYIFCGLTSAQTHALIAHSHFSL
jgi:hypothetical protein